MSLKSIFDIKLLKFLIVGVINTLIGTAVMFLLYNVAHCNYWISSACNYIVGGICSYFLNKYFTFKNNQKSIKQIVLFVINLVCCYLIAYIGAKWLIYKIFENQTVVFKDNIAMCAGMVIYTALNYIIQRYIIFIDKKEESDVRS